MRLEQFDLPATVLLEELKAKGYTGGITILREFIRPLKETFVRRVTERFETLPGHQAQLDWGECGTVAVGSERKKLYVFVLVLGYSRMLYAHFTTSCRLPVLLSCLKDAFDGDSACQLNRQTFLRGKAVLSPPHSHQKRAHQQGHPGLISFTHQLILLATVFLIDLPNPP